MYIYINKFIHNYIAFLLTYIKSISSNCRNNNNNNDINNKNIYLNRIKDI